MTIILFKAIRGFVPVLFAIVVFITLNAAQNILLQPELTYRRVFLLGIGLGAFSTAFMLSYFQYQ